MFPLYAHRPFLSYPNEISYLFIYSGEMNFTKILIALHDFLENSPGKVDGLDLGTRDVRDAKRISRKAAAAEVVPSHWASAREEYRVKLFRKINYTDLESRAWLVIVNATRNDVRRAASRWRMRLFDDSRASRLRRIRFASLWDRVFICRLGFRGMGTCLLRNWGICLLSNRESLSRD